MIFLINIFNSNKIKKEIRIRKGLIHTEFIGQLYMCEVMSEWLTEVTAQFYPPKPPEFPPINW